ncbi:sigma-70 family RNA polymerase sigma factor [Mycobacterium sp. SM1]|uniref:sigma-70 family RNA polymerase sigma factor n=1 Tax=Mycobacterium sp. SM1 TaxID=2816243 RepID=UPI001BCDE0FA|nr:sigma-70 family RNA polymerase sigma factor [Mycobacterium sp. SM1]MBS4727710.1 sigma-70 family RNA polymerase sigma factor [Mycobacterium sp. SM1]
MSTREIADCQTTELALAAGRGDRDALAEFVRATQHDLWRFLAHLSGADAAEDLAQETYLRAITSLPRFAGQSSARTWLLAIARRVSIDHTRREMARPRIAARADWAAAADRAAARRSCGHEDIVELGLLLDGLCPEQREALVLTQVIGMSYAQAADVMGCQVGTIRSRVARAREELIEARSAAADAG